MRTLEDALDQLAYHPATPEVSAKYAAMRAECARLVKNTWQLIPDGAEKTLAMRGLQQFLMHANLAIALTTPADYATSDVARVLPTEWICERCKQVRGPRETKHLTSMYPEGSICGVCMSQLSAPGSINFRA